MKRTYLSLPVLVLLASSWTATAQQSAATPQQWKAVETALGRSGAMQPGDVFSFPCRAKTSLSPKTA